MKQEPLSLTIDFGNPCVANIYDKCSIVTSDVDELTTCASIHFEHASIKSNIIEPCIGPAPDSNLFVLCCFLFLFLTPGLLIADQFVDGCGYDVHLHAALVCPFL